MVKLIADGLTNIEIAERLHIAPSTVKIHVQSALIKLRAQNRYHLVAQWLRAEPPEGRFNQ